LPLVNVVFDRMVMIYMEKLRYCWKWH
jgi:hypothetical protein